MSCLKKESSTLGILADFTKKDRIMIVIQKWLHRFSIGLEINLLRINSSQISKQKKIDTNACVTWKKYLYSVHMKENWKMCLKLGLNQRPTKSGVLSQNKGGWKPAVNVKSTVCQIKNTTIVMIW